MAMACNATSGELLTDCSIRACFLPRRVLKGLLECRSQQFGPTRVPVEPVCDC